MTRNLDAVPGTKSRVNLLLGLLDFLLHLRDFFLETDVNRVRFGVLFQLLKLGLQLGNRLFEVEMVLHLRQNLGILVEEAIKEEMDDGLMD